jgi:hypothetical protein
MRKEDRILVTKFQDELAMKYGEVYASDPNNKREILVRRLNHGRKLKVNPISDAIQHAVMSTRKRSATNNLIQELHNNAPVVSGYGLGHMFNYVNKNNGVVILGMPGATGGQMIGSPYMVHLNFHPLENRWIGWIDRAISKAEDYASQLGLEIPEPLYEYGASYITIEKITDDF